MRNGDKGPEPIGCPIPARRSERPFERRPAPAGDLAAKSGKILMTSELAMEYGFVDATGAMPVGGMASGAGVEAQAFFRSLLGKTPPFGGELGDFSQTNNEGVKACFHGY